MSMYDKNKRYYVKTSMLDDLIDSVPAAMAITKALGFPSPADDIKMLKGFSNEELSAMSRETVVEIRDKYKRRSLLPKIACLLLTIELAPAFLNGKS